MTGGSAGPGTDPPAWRPTVALVTAVAGGLVLLVLAATARRPTLAVLAVPLLADAAWALRRIARAPLDVTVTTFPRRVHEGDDVEVVVAVHAPADADLVQTTVETLPLVTVADPARPVCRLPPRAPVVLAGRARRWGRAAGAQAFVTAWAGHGLLRADPVVAVGAPLAVEPASTPSGRAGPVRRLTGVVGPRPSRRPGAGSEFATVRPFVVGDRLRHVNWRVTARRQDLHVTTTSADREASLLLAVDTTSELGPPGSTSLDVAVRAAATLARRHLFAGDRVGLVDLAAPTRVLLPGAGRRHLDRVVDRLIGLRRRSPGDLRPWPAVLRRTAPDAVVVVLSPLLREAVASAVARLAQLGRTVIVVDTLADVTDRAGLSAAERLLRLEQEATVERLVDGGVAVVPWRGGAEELERAMLRGGADPRQWAGR